MLPPPTPTLDIFERDCVGLTDAVGHVRNTNHRAMAYGSSKGVTRVYTRTVASSEKLNDPAYSDLSSAKGIHCTDTLSVPDFSCGGNDRDCQRGYAPDAYPSAASAAAPTRRGCLLRVFPESGVFAESGENPAFPRDPRSVASKFSAIPVPRIGGAEGTRGVRCVRSNHRGSPTVRRLFTRDQTLALETVARALEGKKA